jgi:hypothetical protein
MKSYQGGIVTGRKVRFAIVKVEEGVLENKEEAVQTIQSLLPKFEGLPVVLVSEKEGEAPKYFARPDLMQYLMDFHLPSVNWKEYQV